jgi:hypothetical protein
MYTEEQARTKWCPFVRIANGRGNAVAVNALMDSDAQRCCIASECMSWRWVEWGRPDNDGMIRPTKSDKGYCGLAGEP